eukprot:383584-Pleurochrysis_carterae.AAC.1
MPPPPPQSTRSPCRNAAYACASVLGQLRCAERCGRRCRSRRLRGRLHLRWPRGVASAAAARTPCGSTGRAQSQFCPGA